MQLDDQSLASGDALVEEWQRKNFELEENNNAAKGEQRKAKTDTNLDSGNCQSREFLFLIQFGCFGWRKKKPIPSRRQK